MKTHDCSQNTPHRAHAKPTNPLAALLGSLTLFVPGAALWAATVEYDLTIARQEQR
jgi:hypothetical protein